MACSWREVKISDSGGEGWEELKPAYVDAVTKYWVGARQAKMIEDAKGVDKGCLRSKCQGSGGRGEKAGR